MVATGQQLNETLHNLPYGSHLCCIYDVPGKQFSALGPFFHQGLQQRDKCVHVLDENTREELFRVLTRADFPITEALRAGSFLVETSENTYYRNGSFDTDRRKLFSIFWRPIHS